jgi:hypothetical protein
VTLTGVADAATAIYDVTDPQHPVQLTGLQITPGGSFAVSFAHQLSSAAQYIAAAPSQFLAPGGITPDVPSHLRQPAQGADWIIITHADFTSAAQTLADHRRTWQGLRTAVVDVQDVYDEFNGGLMDQEATCVEPVETSAASSATPTRTGRARPRATWFCWAMAITTRGTTWGSITPCTCRPTWPRPTPSLVE